MSLNELLFLVMVVVVFAWKLHETGAHIGDAGTGAVLGFDLRARRMHVEHGTSGAVQAWCCFMATDAYASC